MTGRNVIQLPCACANLRRAERAVSQLYDDVLRPSGLRHTQFTLLQALTHAPGIAQKDLAQLLGIDSTTLTRTLAPQRRKGWLRTEHGSDRRELHLSLTTAGKREYQRVLPFWQKAQKSLQQALGKEGWDALLNVAVRIAGVMQAGEKFRK